MVAAARLTAVSGAIAHSAGLALVTAAVAFEVSLWILMLLQRVRKVYVDLVLGFRRGLDFSACMDVGAAFTGIGSWSCLCMSCMLCYHGLWFSTDEIDAMVMIHEFLHRC